MPEEVREQGKSWRDAVTHLERKLVPILPSPPELYGHGAELSNRSQNAFVAHS